MSTFRELVNQAIEDGIIQIKGMKAKTKEEKSVNKLSTNLYKHFKNSPEKIREKFYKFILSSEYNLDKKKDKNGHIIISKTDLISAIFFMYKDRLKDSDWYNPNKRIEEKQRVFEEIKKYWDKECPNFLEYLTNKKDKSEKLPEIQIE